MLKLIEGSYASFFPKEIDAMFRNRAETFSERLGWEVVVKDGYERDAFDDANPLYLVSVDPDTEEYWGSLRLLPTTGPNMLRDVFPQLLDGDYIESATIWECSRICATAVARPAGTKRRRRQPRPERAHFGHRRSCGRRRTDPNRGRLRRQDPSRPKAAGCNPEIIGTPQPIGEVMCYAGLFDTGEGPLKAFRAATGIEPLGPCAGRQGDRVRMTRRRDRPIRSDIPRRISFAVQPVSSKSS